MFENEKMIESKRIHTLYLIWVILTLFILAVIVLHSTTYNSLVFAVLSVVILCIFSYYNLKNLKI